MKLEIYLKFHFGQSVYLRTDKEQEERMVTEVKIDCNMGVLYGLSLGVETTWHFDHEISSEKDIVKSLK